MITDEQRETVRWLADRIRDGKGPPELWDKHVDAVKAAWPLEQFRADADIVIDKFPGLFPLLGKRAAH